MANSAGMLKESIWRDPDWRRLPRTAQATYAQLLSQKELDRCGMLPLQITKWVKGCDEITEPAMWHDLKLLEERHFVVIDEDNDELFIRSYMRHNQIAKYPQFIKAAVRCAMMVESLLIRQELAIELRRLQVADADSAADQLDPGKHISEPFQNRSRTVLEPFENPVGTVNGSGTLRERCMSGSGSGSGSPTVRTHLGEQPAPKIVCPKHPDGTDEPCRTCRTARERNDANDADREATHRAQLESFWAEVRSSACCDDKGWTENDDEITRCPNHDWINYQPTKETKH